MGLIMFRAAVTQNTKSKRELWVIGQRLRELIQKDDSASRMEALTIIKSHQNDSEVINAKWFNQSTPLILACALGKTEIVEELLNAKCIDVNLTGRAKTNALATALKAGKYDIALLLANDMRVNINATDSDGVHPAFYVMTYPHSNLAIAMAIISRPDMDLTAAYEIKFSGYRANRTILHSMITQLGYLKSESKDYQDLLALIKKVLATGIIDVNAFEIADIKSRNEIIKKTPLILAAERGMPDVVELLLSAGADTELRNEKGQRAVDLGCYYEKVVEAINQHKKDSLTRQTSMSMFSPHQNMPEAQPVLPEYLEPPKPSAPPAEDVNEDATCGKPVMR